MRLYLLHYNNYKNRISKLFTTLASYVPYAVSNTVPYLSETNFNPNDGVSTEQIIGSGTVPWTYGDPDYLVVADDNGTQIISRWFVIEAPRLRYGQHKLILRRDVLAEKRALIMTAPAMITKGMLSISDDGIFNAEPMTFSQIKQSEHLLQDVTMQAWVVGYFAPPTTDKTFTIPADTSLHYKTYASLADIPYYANSKIIRINDTTITGTYRTGGFSSSQAFGLRYRITFSGGSTADYECAVYNSADSDLSVYIGTPALYRPDDDTRGQMTAQRTIGPHVADMQATLNGDIQTANATLLDTIGQYYLVGTSLYKVTGITTKTTSGQTTAITSSGMPTTYASMTAYAAEGFSGTPNDNSFFIYGDVTQFLLVVEEQASGAVTCTIPATARELNDAPYAMFTYPLSGSYVLDGTTYYNSPDFSIKLATAISKELGTGCYDVQILPYCPRADFLGGGGTMFLGTVAGQQYGTLNEDYAELTTGGTTCGAICFCVTSSFQTSISRSSILSISSDPIQFKVDSQTRFCRICSPNYNGQFEFTPEKNGSLKYFDIFCTYKPYNPYIQVAPRFGRLYGDSFQDARGLICAGDWSLPQVSDAWINFELNNKNYQQSFDRQIQSLELQQNQARIHDILAAITGTVSGGITGAATGATVGGGYGAIAGAVVGTVGSAATGVADVYMSEELRKDAMSLKKDLFSYEMQNIRAIPQSLTRVSALTKVFKVFPFLEIFDAPRVEKEALYNKIRYNGMTIMRIGKIQDFLGPSRTFVQGHFIWLEDLDEDYHVAQAITDEFEKGVYIE